MPLPLLPLLVGSLVAAAYHQSSKNAKLAKGSLTPARQMIFDTAMNDTKEPAKLRALAKTFRDEGLPHQADMLEKRAKLRELPPEVSKTRREIFKKAMNSQDATAVHKIANAYESQGATGAAASLRKYAASIPITPQNIVPGVAIPVIPKRPIRIHGEAEEAQHMEATGGEEPSFPLEETLTESEPTDDETLENEE